MGIKLRKPVWINRRREIRDGTLMVWIEEKEKQKTKCGSSNNRNKKNNTLTYSTSSNFHRDNFLYNSKHEPLQKLSNK